jgi:DNA-binding transcriptional ArsR family regulator
VSYQASQWAFEQPVGSPGAKLVLAALAHRADERGYCYPGQEALARMTGLDERTVRSHLKRLEAGGYISRSRATDERGRRMSDDIYLLAPPERLSFSPEKSSANQPDNRKKTARPYRKNQPPEKSPAKESEDKDEESDHKNPEARPPASPPAADDGAAAAAHREGMRFLGDRCGPIPDAAAQGAALKWLLAHYTLDECRACFDGLLAQGWRTARVSWLTVKKEIGSWVKRKEKHDAGDGRPQTDGGRDHAEAGGGATTRVEQYRQESLRQMREVRFAGTAAPIGG